MGKYPAGGPYRKKLDRSGTSAWLANQIQGFKIPARSDAWEKNVVHLVSYHTNALGIAPGDRWKKKLPPEITLCCITKSLILPNKKQPILPSTRQCKAIRMRFKSAWVSLSSFSLFFFPLIFLFKRTVHETLSIAEAFIHLTLAWNNYLCWSIGSARYWKFCPFFFFCCSEQEKQKLKMRYKTSDSSFLWSKKALRTRWKFLILIPINF